MENNYSNKTIHLLVKPATRKRLNRIKANLEEKTATRVSMDEVIIFLLDNLKTQKHG